MNNDTPRTDAAIKEVLQSGPHQKVRADFARSLEIRLAELERENESLTGQLDDALNALYGNLRGKGV